MAPGYEKMEADSTCGWRIFIQRQGCLRGQPLLHLLVTLLCARSSGFALGGGGSDRGGQGTTRAWLGAAKAVVWRGKVPRVGSRYPGPSQNQPVQATFTHSSQLLVVMVSGQGKKTGHEAEHESETSVVQGADGQVAREGLRREPASFSQMKSMRF